MRLASCRAARYVQSTVRMKASILILALMFVVSPARADTRELFAWRAPLLGTWTYDEIYRAEVSPAVWDATESFPADLRIYDENEREWPFYITGVQAPGLESPWTIVLIENTVETSPSRYLRRTIHLQARTNAAGLPHHQAIIQMAGHDFERRVDVLGRNEGLEWTWLGQANLINRPGSARSANRTVFYEPSLYTQLQFRIYPSVSVPDEPLVLLGVTVLSPPPADAETWLPLEWRPPANEPAMKGLQSLLTDVGYQHIPLRYVKLDMGPGEGAFPVKVFGRFTPTNTWRWIADGAVHAVNGHLRSTIELQQTGYRYLKLDCYAYDQQTVQVVRSQGGYETLYVVFEADYGQHPHLYFGSSHPPLPRFDLQRRVGPGLPAGALIAELGEKRRNPARIAAALRIYGRTLGYSALGVLAGLGLLVTLKRWRHRADD